MDTCGIPSKASWHTLLIIGKGDSITGTDTSYMDIYSREDHFTEYEVGQQIETGWEVLEVTDTHLRHDTHYQFINGDTDITTQPLYAEDDATEVRVWAGDECIAAAAKDDFGTWRASSCDNTHWTDVADLGTYGNWEDILNRSGFKL
jgi:hypothetical protein